MSSFNKAVNAKTDISSNNLFKILESKHIYLVQKETQRFYLHFGGLKIIDLKNSKFSGFNSAVLPSNKSNRKAMNRNWSNQKANPTLKTKTGYK